MNTRSNVFFAAVLFAASNATHAFSIDFKALADGAIGESAWTTMMFKADGTHTTTASEAFVQVTGSNGTGSPDPYAYMDSNNAGLGVCGTLYEASNADQVFPSSGANLCNPSSDDNVSDNGGTPERLHFVFDASVIIDKVWLNNAHDGDTSLDGDSVLLKVGTGSEGSKSMDGFDGTRNDWYIVVGNTTSFDIGYDASSSTCVDSSANNCEFYISAISYSMAPTAVPEPTSVALLGLGLLALGYRRRKV